MEQHCTAADSLPVVVPAAATASMERAWRRGAAVAR